MSNYPEWQAKPREAAQQNLDARETALQASIAAQNERMAPILTKALQRAGIDVPDVTEQFVVREGWKFGIVIDGYYPNNFYALTVEHSNAPLWSSYRTKVCFVDKVEELTGEYNEEFAVDVGLQLMELQKRLDEETPEEISVPDPTPAEKLYDLIQEMIDRSLDERGIGI